MSDAGALDREDELSSVEPPLPPPPQAERESTRPKYRPQVIAERVISMETFLKLTANILFMPWIKAKIHHLRVHSSKRKFCGRTVNANLLSSRKIKPGIRAFGHVSTKAKTNAGIARSRVSFYNRDLTVAAYKCCNAYRLSQ